VLSLLRRRRVGVGRLW